MIQHILLVLLLLLGAAEPFAQEDDALSSACRDGEAALGALREEARVDAARIALIERVLAGDASAGMTAAEVDQLLDGGEALQGLPEDLRCAALRDEYRELSQAYRDQRARLSDLRARYWDALATPVRRGLERIRSSSLRLSESAAALQDALGSERLARLRGQLEDDIGVLDALRAEYLALLPTLEGEVDAADAGAWISRWREALDVSLSFKPSAGDAMAGLTPAQRSALAQHRRLLWLDAVTLAGSFNLVRGWLWQEHRAAVRAVVPEARDRLHLLRDEGRALVNALQWIYLDTVSRDDSLRERVVWWRLLFGIEYLVGLCGFVLLVLFARRAASLASTWQATFARRYRGTRAAAQLIRVTAGVPEWLPWVIGWGGLRALESLFREHGLVLLLPLLPFAQLFIVYGLLSMTGEWFVSRMAELGGSFLTEQQQAEASRRSRRAAAIVILPWLLMACVRLAVGPSLVLSWLDLVTLLALVLALGLLLRPWQDAFIRALQAVLPERFDRPCERLFRGPRFVILAPVAAPLMLVAMALFFVHKSLVHFDWYRRLMARSFLLRSVVPDEVEMPVSDEAELSAYRQWFDAGPADSDVPVIRCASSPDLESLLDDWLCGRTEENTLLFHGERSSGKSTLLRRAEERILERASPPVIHRLDVPAKCATPAAVAALLNPVFDVALEQGPAELVKSDAARPQTIVMLDNAQNLFLRSVGGLAGWEFLLGLTRARLRNVFWVVAINNQSWAFLANVFGRYYQFNRLVATRPWSQSEIRSLILSRHQLSGRRIEYDRILLSSRGPEAGNIRNAEQLYFSLLWDSCSGNPGIALQLWLTSITVNGGTVTVSIPDEVAGAALERLGDDFYFVYAALVLHENMTADEVVQTTALPESVVRQALKVAFDIGFLERSGDRRYRIMPLWYRSVIRLMARKNLLHE